MLHYQYVVSILESNQDYVNNIDIRGPGYHSETFHISEYLPFKCPGFIKFLSCFEISLPSSVNFRLYFKSFNFLSYRPTCSQFSLRIPHLISFAFVPQANVIVNTATNSCCRGDPRKYRGFMLVNLAIVNYAAIILIKASTCGRALRFAYLITSPLRRMELMAAS